MEGTQYQCPIPNATGSKEFERNQMFLDLMSDFLEALKSGKAPLTNLSDIIGGQLITLTIKKSLQTGLVEKIIKIK